MIYRIKVVGQVEFEKCFKSGADALRCGLLWLPVSPSFKVYIFRQISKGFLKVVLSIFVL